MKYTSTVSMPQSIVDQFGKHNVEAYVHQRIVEAIEQYRQQRLEEIILGKVEEG